MLTPLVCCNGLVLFIIKLINMNNCYWCYLSNQTPLQE